jgi:glycosyltransferase involved in cell wall biosynthesis
MISRVFIVDSNLIKTSGHPAQFCLALEQTCNRLGLEVHVLTNRRIQPEALALFRNPRALVTCTSFEMRADGPVRFAQDLLEAHAQYHFAHDDLILITSAHVNEVAGVAKFERSILVNQRPAVALNFHQLFPPATPASLATTQDYQQLWMGKLREAFSTMQDLSSRVSLWTTSVEGLNRAYRLLSGRQVGELPLIFAMADGSHTRTPEIEFSGRRLIMAFLGDGRREKGLLLFLMAIRRLRDVHLSFWLQNIDARGYGAGEWQEFRRLLVDIQTLPDVRIVTKTLTPGEFHHLLHRVDAVVLPYDPGHYKDRASAVFIQAAQAEKPVVVADGTWMASELRRGRAGGVTFQYGIYSAELAATNLQRAILQLQQQFDVYQHAAQRAADYYRDSCTPERYLNIVLGYYRPDQ